MEAGTILLVPPAPTAFQLPAVPAAFHPSLPLQPRAELRDGRAGKALWELWSGIAALHCIGRKGCGAGGTTAEGMDGALGTVLGAGK